MDIKLVFSLNREHLQFYIRDKIIYYTDRKWKNWVQCIPKDKDLIKIILKSRNAVPHQLAELFNLSKEEMKEYNDAKDDDELAKIIKMDGKGKGLILQKEMKE